MCCLEERGASWKKQAEQQEGQEGALPGFDVPSWVEEKEEVDEAEVTGKELELGNVLVSGTSGLVAGLVSLGTEVLLVDVAGVICVCVMRCCTGCINVVLKRVTTAQKKAQVHRGWV